MNLTSICNYIMEKDFVETRQCTLKDFGCSSHAKKEEKRENTMAPIAKL